MNNTSSSPTLNSPYSAPTKRRQVGIDQNLIGAYASTLSLPVEPSKNSRIAAKIVDNRGIESLKVMDISVELKREEV